MNLKNRLNILEDIETPEELPIIDRVLVDSKEQVDHPERFEKVLISEKVGESGCKSRLYELKRK